jgi:hypothetical protein
LNQFANALHTYSQSASNLPVSEALCPQQYTLTLLRRELSHGTFEVPHALVQKDALFRTRSWIYVFANHRTRFLVFILGRPSLRAVDIHGKIVSDTENPSAKIVGLFALKASADEAKECILDYVFGLIRTHAQAAKIRSQRGSQVVVEINNSLAVPCATGGFRNQYSKITTDHRISFRTRA